MDVNEAFMLINGRRMSIQDQTQIEWNINQKGEDYNGFLFRDNEYITTANYHPYE